MNLVLQTRMDSLQAHLEKIQDFLVLVRKRQGEFQELQTILTTGDESTESSARLVHDIIIELKLHSQLVTSTELPRAETEFEKLISLRDQLARARWILSCMRTLSSQIEGLGIGQALKDILKNRAEGCKNALSDIREQLRKAADVKDAWEKYSNMLSSRTLPLFAEYVEFLGGLALRDAGFDAGICQIADELIQSYVMSPGACTDLLTIPVQQRAVALTLERIIHLNFPEWTIWALPFTAHEFWYVMACKHEKIRQRVEEHAQITAELHVYLADAFATYAMGLAYAYSAVLLRFDPYPTRTRESEEEKKGKDNKTQESDSDSLDNPKQARWLLAKLKSMNNNAAGNPWIGLISQLEQQWQGALKLNEKAKESDSDAKRAFCVFAMLKWMDGRADGRPWKGLISQLEQEWEGLVEQVNPAALTLEPAFKEQMEKLIDALGTVLHLETRMNFPMIEWGSIAAWVGKLLEDKVTEIPLQGTEELRHVLNAAWLARFRAPARTEDIAKAAQKLRQRISEDKSRRAEASKPTTVPLYLRAGE